MYDQRFLRAINFVLSREGEYTNDPKDPGNWTGGKEGVGELNGTRYGISAAQYPTIDIATLRRDDAIAIYYRDYWVPISGDNLPPRLQLAVLDCAVNQGVGTAGKILQTALGITGDDVDGKIGLGTLGALRTKEPEDVLTDFLAARAVRYAKSKNFDVYGRGWYRRLFFCAMESVR